MNEYLVKALKEGRANKGLKQSDVAELVGVKANTLSNYENGVSEPDIDTFANLCEIYGLDFSYVLGEAYGLNVSGTNFDIRPSEIEIIKNYRSLDPHGKEMVDLVLYKEHSRCSEFVVIESHQINTDSPKRLAAYSEGLRAAHNDHLNEEGELEKVHKDLSTLKKPK